MVPPQRKPPSHTCPAAMSLCDFYIHWKLMDLHLHWLVAVKLWDTFLCGCPLCSVRGIPPRNVCIEGLWIVWNFIHCRINLHSVCMLGRRIKWCAGKCPLKILIFFPSFLFHFKPSSGNGSWFKNEISDLPANISRRGLNLHFTQKKHFSQLSCLSKHQCLNQGKEEMQRMEKCAPGATAEERACLRDSAGALKAGIQH